MEQSLDRAGRIGERGGVAERVREQQRRVRTGLLGVRCAPGLVGVLRRGASGLFAGEQRQNGVDVPLVPGVCGGTAIVGCGVGGQPVARAVGGVCGVLLSVVDGAEVVVEVVAVLHGADLGRVAVLVVGVALGAVRAAGSGLELVGRVVRVLLGEAARPRLLLRRPVADQVVGERQLVRRA